MRLFSSIVLIAFFFLQPARANTGIPTLALRARKASVGLSCRGPSGRYFGTGTIIREDGVVLTSSTVLPPGASDIRVYLPDGRILPATLVKVDERLELALAQLDGSGYPFLPLGGSGASRIGERVLSLGNAFESAAGEGVVSVGAGIVTGKYRLDRAFGGATYTGDVIETDAPLNPGSDGGALVDSAGSVIGVLSLNYSPIRLLGTAVPVDKLKPRIKELVGEVPHRTADGATAIDPRILEAWSDRVVAIKVERIEDVDFDPKRLPPGLEPWRWERLRSKIPSLLRRPAGVVSGACISQEGLVLTSHYNVAGKLKEIKVRDVSGKWVRADLVAVDEVDDLALLRAQSGRWIEAPLADPSEIAVGKGVFLLGRSPDPEALTVTGGIVSAVERNGDRLFQHDAAENAGNTGGPIIDRRGRFLGIACYVGHVWPEWSFNSGIGFGVRPDQLRKALARLRKGENVPRPELPFLGIKRQGMGPDTGEVRVEVLPGYPAAKAGVKNGDRILKIGSKDIGSWLDLRRAISGYSVGDSVTMVIERNGERKMVEVVLTARPK